MPPSVAVPLTLYDTTVALSLVVVMVSVKRPSTVPVSFASVVATIDTVAVSLSRILTVAGVASIPISALSVPVSVTITVSVPSTIVSSMMPATSMVAVVAPAGIVTFTGKVV